MIAKQTMLRNKKNKNLTRRKDLMLLSLLEALEIPPKFIQAHSKRIKEMAKSSHPLNQDLRRREIKEILN
jgi:hypothetical protein